MYQFVGEVMIDISSRKEITHCATLGIPKRIKTADSICIAPGGEIVIRNEKLTF